VRVLIVTPARAGSTLGNRATALRWQRHLRALGHRVSIATTYREGPWDVVFALHAKKSASAVFAARARGTPCVLAMTGTDLYRDVARSARARRALVEADRIVVLHERGADDLPSAVRSKVRVVEQSAVVAPRTRRGFDVVVVGHLRAVKDPFRAAMAARRLPESSAIRVVHVGGALTDAMQRRAEREMRVNRRYVWLGERAPAAARAWIARARVLVLSSQMEGGANVLSEALVAGTPILASRIPSSVGVLGHDYPGFFPVGATDALVRLLLRVESEPGFLSALRRAGRARRARFAPQCEQATLRALLRELDFAKP